MVKTVLSVNSLQGFQKLYSTHFYPSTLKEKLLRIIRLSNHILK